MKLRNSVVYVLQISTFFCFLFFSPFVVHAGYLKFDQSSISTSINQTFQVQVIVDAGTDQITSADMWVLYDTNYLEAQSVESGTFFPAVTNNISPGKVSVTGLVTDPGTYKTGSGTVATITFKALTNGSTSLTYDCRTEVSNSSKIIRNDVNATNVIICGSNTTATVNIGVAGSTTTSTSTSTQTAPTYIPATSTGGETSTTLPQTGTFENVVKYAVPGIMLVMMGWALKLIL